MQKGLAYVGDSNDWIWIVDVSIPAAPVEVGVFELPGWSLATGVAAAGDYAYVAQVGNGLRVLDVSDPTAPFEIGFHVGVGFSYAEDVVVADGLVVVADGDAGMNVFRQCGLGMFSDGFESGDLSAWSAVSAISMLSMTL